MKNTRKLILVLLLMLIFCSVLPVKASTWLPVASKWNIVTVDSLANDQCLKLDSIDQPHISYHNLEVDLGDEFDLKYAVLRGNSWAVITVDSDHYAGYESSLAIDSENRPHITYGVLWLYGFETVSNDSPIITNMDLNNHVNAFSLSESGNVQNHISQNGDNTNSYDYINFDISTDYLKYAFWDGRSWNITTVFEDTGDYHSSLALDSEDRPHISYDDSCLKLIV